MYRPLLPIILYEKKPGLSDFSGSSLYGVGGSAMLQTQMLVASREDGGGSETLKAQTVRAGVPVSQPRC